MRLRTAKGFRDYDALTAQLEDEFERYSDDPDWYAPVLTPKGVVFCVRPSLAASPAKRALGLSPLRNQHSRYGLKGASPGTRKKVELTAIASNRFEGRVAFGGYTPSMPDFEAIEDAPGGVASMQKRLGDEITREYKAVGHEPLWMLVPEITPDMSKREGRPYVHWHILAVNKRSKWDKGWWLSLEAWNRAYVNAFKKHVGREPIDVRATVSLTRAKNPARYLSKYLTKNPDGLGGVDFEGHEDAVPRRWFSRSRPAKRLVEEMTTRLPAAFADFLWREWRVLEAEGLGSWGTFVVNERTGWEIGRFRFRSVEALALAWECFVAEGRGSEPSDIGLPGPPGVVPAREEKCHLPVGIGEVRLNKSALQPVNEQLCLSAV